MKHRVSGSTLLLVLCGFLLLRACCCAFDMPGPSTPTDEQMIDHYMEYQTEFDQLAESLVTEDGLLLVYPDSGECVTVERERIEPGESKACDEHVRLFRLLGLGWAYIDDDPFYLSYYLSGLGVSGLRKGFLYTTNLSLLQARIVGSTETQGNPLPRYRRIEGNWYIYLDD